MGLGALLGSSPTAKPSSQRRRSTQSSRSRRRSGSYGRRSRYQDRGSWWTRSSHLKRGWRNTFRPRRQFRRSFFNSHRRIVDIWDPYFLASATTALFWYHHWESPEIHEALYEDHVLEDADLAALELEVKALEAKGVPRDPDYLPEGIGPEDAYSDDYLSQERRRREEGGSGLLFLGFVAIGLGIGFKFFRG